MARVLKVSSLSFRASGLSKAKTKSISANTKRQSSRFLENMTRLSPFVYFLFHFYFLIYFCPFFVFTAFVIPEKIQRDGDGGVREADATLQIPDSRREILIYSHRLLFSLLCPKKLFICVLEMRQRRWIHTHT